LTKASISIVISFTILVYEEKQIPVVVTTQAPGGISNFQVNETGQHLAKNELAVPAHDMNMEAMSTKLAWLLGQNCDYETIKSRMLTELHGEIHVGAELI
jgi:L-asparaginase